MDQLDRRRFLGATAGAAAALGTVQVLPAQEVNSGAPSPTARNRHN